ncbi:MAG: ScyD/ScyE family protein [Actinomycetota bacterium]|nr:ScyD/ScyE family protein [Actinomycetota bacterium]
MGRTKKTARRWWSLVTVALAVTSLLAPLPSVGAKDKQAQVTSIASDLRNPRGIAWHNRALYVAEAGKGGSGPCVEGAEGEACFGRTGAITRIRDGDQERIARGLPSTASPEGTGALGPHDVAVDDGKLYVTIGLGGPPELRSELGPHARALGRLLRIRPQESRDWVADLAGYEADANPDGGLVDSNPYGVLRRAHSTIATDAGGNSLLRIKKNGDVASLAVFPDRLVRFQGDQVPMQAVPTSVVRGPDGAYYVGQLTGFPFPVGGARVYRVVPGQKPQVYARGFTNIIDIAFDERGRLYVLEIAHNGLLNEEPFGALQRVNRDGSKKVLLEEGLFFPGGLVVRSAHEMYVTNCGVCPETGEVLRVEL